jgi:hypothetical protein
VVRSSGRNAAYDRMIQLFVSGQMSGDLFVRVYMSLWGSIPPSPWGSTSRALHEIFSYLDALDLPISSEEDARSEVSRIWLSTGRP